MRKFELRMGSMRKTWCIYVDGPSIITKESSNDRRPKIEMETAVPLLSRSAEIQAQVLAVRKIRKMLEQGYREVIENGRSYNEKSLVHASNAGCD